MSLVEKLTFLNPNKYIVPTRERLLGKPNPIRPEQVRAIEGSLETSFRNILWNSRGNGKPVERVTPKDLNYYFPEVPFVFLNGCGAGTDTEHGGTFALEGGAHTHLCPKDPFYNTICISDKDFVVPKLMWHEYAHAVTKRPYKVVSCNTMEKHELAFNSKKDRDEWNYGHNPEWSLRLAAFGFTPTLGINLSYGAGYDLR